MLSLLVNTGFQVLFHSPPGVLFTFPSRYYALSVTNRILAWRVVPPASRRIPRVLRYSGSRLYFVLSSTGLLPSLEPLSFGLRLELFRLHDPATPIDRSLSVWPLTISLAATKVIEFSFSSSGYLDVSVRRVPSATLCIHVTVMELHSTGFPHSDVYGSMPACGSP